MCISDLDLVIYLVGAVAISLALGASVVMWLDGAFDKEDRHE